MMRVMVKQKHQTNMDQLPMSPFRVSSLATSKKGTQVESSCPRQRKKPMMVIEPRPEDKHMVTQVTVTSTAAVFTENPPEKDPAPEAD